jgi:hypothetical protein
MKGTGLSLWALSALASAPAWGSANDYEALPPQRIDPTIEADETFDVILNCEPVPESVN